MINFAIAFSIGLLTGALAEIALFYGIFVSLRFFCGGYHAKSYGRCFSLFALTCFGYVALLKGILRYVGCPFWILGTAIIFLGICVWLKAPIEHTNRPFTLEERKLFRKRSLQLYLGWSVVGMILWIMKLEYLSAGFACVFVIIAAYMLIERGGRRMKKKVLEVIAKTALSAAKRADGTASEFGLFQPKKPAKKQK